MNEERQRQLYESRDELLRRELSNSQILDKSILSLSSAGLGFSLLLIKNVVPLKVAICMCLLHLSWILFIIAIVSTLLSFLTSQRAINKEIERVDESICAREEKNLNQKNLPDQITTVLSYVSTACYIAAVVLTFLFIALNIRLSTP